MSMPSLGWMPCIPIEPYTRTTVFIRRRQPLVNCEARRPGESTCYIHMPWDFAGWPWTQETATRFGWQRS